MVYPIFNYGRWSLVMTCVSGPKSPCDLIQRIPLFWVPHPMASQVPSFQPATRLQKGEDSKGPSGESGAGEITLFSLVKTCLKMVKTNMSLSFRAFRSHGATPRYHSTYPLVI